MKETTLDGPRLSRNLQVARESVDALDRVEVLRELEWNSEANRWTLLVRLNLPGAPERVPSRSAWYVVLKPTYPWGEIDIYPAIRDGLETTHHHQNLNIPGDERFPWRTGKICVDTGVRALGPAVDTEPYDSDRRLQWRLARALLWLEAAENSELVQPGEPFELPDFRTPVTPLVAFNEDEVSFRRWADVESQRGFVRLAPLRDKPEVLMVRAFQDDRNNDLVVPAWGSKITALSRPDQVGLWIRIPEVPRLAPWRAPVTWRELGDALDPQGVHIPEDLQELLPGVRDQKPHYLLLGFPIPDLQGGEDTILYWLAIRLPRLSNSKRDGFRDGEKAARLNDRTRTFRSDAEIPWVKSENWSPTDLSGRGRLPAEVTDRRFVIIGGGALGCYVAEMLVRGGVSDISLSENDRLKAGNLVRHTATLEDVGSEKGSAVAHRLNAASPHANVITIEAFPPTQAEEVQAVQAADVVVDLTGELAVSAALGAYDWEAGKLFFSVSLGLQAERLFCFAAAGAGFPHDEFLARLQPWLAIQMAESEGLDVPREGIGCWHPVFPARVDDVWLLGAAAVKWIESRIMHPVSSPEMIVFEQTQDEDGFSGIRKRTAPHSG